MNLGSKGGVIKRMSKLERIGEWLRKHASCLENSCRDTRSCGVDDCKWVDLLNILEGMKI